MAIVLKHKFEQVKNVLSHGPNRARYWPSGSALRRTVALQLVERVAV